MKETIPNLSTGFGSTLEHLKEAQFILDDRLAEIWEDITANKGDLIEIDISGLKSLSHPKAYLYGLFSEFGFTQWADMEELLSGQSGKMVYSSTHRLLKDRDSLLLQKIDSLPDAEQSRIIHKGQESVELGSGTLRLELKTTAKELVVKTTHVASFDADKLVFPLIVRKWQKGDYFYPKGMHGRKKLSKFFKDEKLSIPEKENIWLLCAENEVAWIVGLRSDERYKVTEETKSVLHVEWIPK
jgi:tRNA(Ile)-lysidine synthase